jgi:excinuclease ABC subunit B
LDADKEGFLRSDTALIQTIGRAARHVNGKVIMYADNITDSMRRALDETERRRNKQIEFNKTHGIEPVSIIKAIRDLTDQVAAEYTMAERKAEYQHFSPSDMPKNELSRLIKELEKQMRSAAEKLEFERAAALRDQIYEMRQVMVEKEDLPPWKRAKVLAGEDTELY